MKFFRGNRVRLTRLVSTLKRSWFWSWWKASNAVKNNVHLYDFLMYLYSYYTKYRPQTRFLKLIGDVEVGSDAQVRKQDAPIFVPPMVARVHELPDQWDAPDQESPEWFQSVLAGVAIDNDVRANRMKVEMEEATAEINKTEQLRSELEGRLQGQIQTASEAIHKNRETVYQKAAESWNRLDGVLVFYVIAIILITVAEAYLVFATLGDRFGVPISEPIKYFWSRPGYFFAFVTFATTVTAVLVVLSHLLIQKLQKIYTTIVPKWKFISDISLIVVLGTTLVVLATAMSDVRSEAFEDPINGTFKSGDADAGARMQLLMVIMLPLTIGHLTHRALDRSKRRKDTPGNRHNFPLRTRIHDEHELDIKSLQNDITEVCKQNQIAKANILNLYKEAEAELDRIKSLIDTEEKILLAYVDAIYAALMADRFTFLNTALKKGKKELTTSTNPDNGIGSSHHNLLVLHDMDDAREEKGL